jgi:hypothetical protein
MDAIERLERRIEDLREAIERSRRYMLAGRAATIAGPVLLAAILFGLISFTPALTILGLALGIGGMVLTGSSRATTLELERALTEAKAERNAAIDGLDLVDLGGR